MKRVTIGLSTSRRWNPFSALIKRWWGTSYSHFFIKWNTPWGFEEILEASSGSLHMISQAWWKKKNRVIMEVSIDITRSQWGQLMTEIRGQSGAPYSWKQIGGIMLRELFQLSRNPVPDSRGWICSEVGAHFIEILGQSTGKDREDVTPYDIEKFILDKLK